MRKIIENEKDSTWSKAKNGVIKLVLVILSIIAIAIIMKVHMQRSWTYRLVEGIQTEDEEKVAKLLDKKLLGKTYDVNVKPHQPFPMSLFGECQESVPLVYACETGNYQIIRLLVEAGADVNIHMEGDFVPLEAMLLRFGYTENWKDAYQVVELLVEHGADVDYITDDYYSLYELAAQMLPYEEETYLEEMEEIIFNVFCLLQKKGKHGDEYMGKCLEEAEKYDNYKIVNHILRQDKFSSLNAMTCRICMVFW